jgi:hypothetical protein
MATTKADKATNIKICGNEAPNLTKTMTKTLPRTMKRELTILLAAMTLDLSSALARCWIRAFKGTTKMPPATLTKKQKMASLIGLVINIL